MLRRTKKERVLIMSKPNFIDLPSGDIVNVNHIVFIEYKPSIGITNIYLDRRVVSEGMSIIEENGCFNILDSLNNNQKD
jgi:hypothetical protein